MFKCSQFLLELFDRPQSFDTILFKKPLMSFEMISRLNKIAPLLSSSLFIFSVEAERHLS